MQIKTTMRYCLTTCRFAIVKKKKTENRPVQLRSRGYYVFIWDRTFLQLIAFSDQQSYTKVSQVVLMVKNTSSNSGDTGVMDSIPGRSPEGRHGNSLQYSRMKNPKYRGTCQATVHKVPKHHIQLK